ncbi:MAG: septum formation protein Maf [Oscillospiraceae bacterium]|nr:septum formation protein Maf [Oscillospiraceae bacterium]
MHYVLASASPRRRELAELMGLDPLKILPAVGEERADPGLTGGALAEALALHKAREVAQRCEPDDIVIGADTIVCLDDAVFGKPRDAADAARMLRALSGRAHTVYTGVAVVRGGETRTHAEATRVRFRALTESEIAGYIETGEPMDKAGAYGIQGKGSLLISGIDGDFFNVMGLPVCALGEMLKLFGTELL